MRRSVLLIRVEYCGRLLSRLLVLCLVTLFIKPPVALGQNAERDSISERATAHEPRNAFDESQLTAAEKDRQRQTAIAGMMVLGLVVVVLTLLALLAIWWAQRIRRQLDRPLPKQHPGDPLWYLRKGPPTDTSPTDTQPESNTENLNG